MSATASVVSAFRVLECVADQQPAGLSELARNLDLPKATVQRCLTTLAELGWVRSGGTPARWSLTARAFSIGVKAPEHQRLREPAIPLMNALQLETQETIHLCVPERREMVLIERLDTSHPLRAFLPLGYRFPMHAAATGLAYLAALHDDEVDAYIEEGLEARGPATIIDGERLHAAITGIRERNYSINEQGLHRDVTAIGACIQDRAGRPLGSISVSGPSVRMTEDLYEKYGNAVATAAARIAEQV